MQIAHIRTFIKTVWQDKGALFSCAILILIAIGLSPYSNENRLAGLVCNVAYGYVAGYAFYIPSVIIPKTKRIIEVNRNIKSLSAKILGSIGEIEERLFSRNGVPQRDAYWITMRTELLTGPFRRDTEIMKQPHAIKPDLIRAFAIINAMTTDLQRVVLDGAEDDCIYQVLTRYSAMYDLYIKPGYLNGEHADIRAFADSFLELKEQMTILNKSSNFC